MTEQLSLFDSPAGSEEPESELMQQIEPIALHKDKIGARLLDLIPDGALFALNRGYGTRAVHVARILSLLQEKSTKEQVVTRDEIAQRLSMTWAAAQGTINVMRRACLITAQTTITPFGSLVLSRGPYLDNPGLLWLLHYLLASNALLVLWSNLFNFVLPEHEEITIQRASEAFRPLEGRWSEKTVREKARHELGGIFKTYTEDLFAPLRLLVKLELGAYQSFWEAMPVPAAVWLSVLLVYRDRYYPGASTLEVPLFVHAHYSPGRILRYNETSTRRALDELHNADLLTVETRSGLDQVRFKRDVTWLSAVAEHLQLNRKA